MHHSKFGPRMSQLGQYLPKAGVCGRSVYRSISDIKCGGLHVECQQETLKLVALRSPSRFSFDFNKVAGVDFYVVRGCYTASSVTVAKRPRKVRRPRIVVASKATKTKWSCLATFNAEVQTWTIWIGLIRALAGFVFVVRRTIIKIIIAVRRQGLLTERPNGGRC